jgi:DNA polymerase-3 subunit delta
VLADLLHDQQSPIMILSVMGKYFRQLYTARLCLESGGSREKFMALWQMRYSYQADKLMDGARKFSLLWCRHAVRRCAETDVAMKSYGGDEEELLIGLLMELSAGRRVVT